MNATEITGTTFYVQKANMTFFIIFLGKKSNFLYLIQHYNSETEEEMWLILKMKSDHANFGFSAETLYIV